MHGERQAAASRQRPIVDDSETHPTSAPGPPSGPGAPPATAASAAAAASSPQEQISPPSPGPADARPQPEKRHHPHSSRGSQRFSGAAAAAAAALEAGEAPAAHNPPRVVITGVSQFSGYVDLRGTDVHGRLEVTYREDVEAYRAGILPGLEQVSAPHQLGGVDSSASTSLPRDTIISPDPNAPTASQAAGSGSPITSVFQPRRDPQPDELEGSAAMMPLDSRQPVGSSAPPTSELVTMPSSVQLEPPLGASLSSSTLPSRTPPFSDSQDQDRSQPSDQGVSSATIPVSASLPNYGGTSGEAPGSGTSAVPASEARVIATAPLGAFEGLDSFRPADAELQRKVREIIANASLSEAEKNRQRQALFAEPYNRKRNAEAEVAREKVTADAKQRSYSSVNDSHTGDPMLGCVHYPRNCKIQAKCCGLWCVCRLCHDRPELRLDHQICRRDTERVMCMHCFTEQAVSNNCISCHVTFARYFCAICKFYDNTPGKDIYHCDQCGICRVGKGLGLDNFHCDKCNACVSIESKANHNCISKSLDADCPICNVYLFTSTDPVVFMRCGHTMHSHCFDDYTRKNYTCPLCNKSLTNMTGYYEQIDRILEHDRMPPEYDNHFSDILCYDCNLKSRTKYHFVYHKCEKAKGGCGGYNTRVLHSCVVNPQVNDGAGAISETTEIAFRESRRVTTTGIHPPILPAERDHPTLQVLEGPPEENSRNDPPADGVMFVSGDGENAADETTGNHGGPASG